VLLISIDTLRPDYLSCYGNPVVQTPHIDSLSQRGTLMEHAVAQIPLTLPSHTSMLTGLYPTHHGVHDNGGFYLSEKIETIAEVFKKQGFATAGFIAGFPLDSRFGLSQGFDTYDDKLPIRAMNFDIAMPQLPAHMVVDDVLNWMKSSKTDKWFVFLHLYDPHHPYQPPDEYKKKYPNNFYAGEIAYVDDQLNRVFTYLAAQKMLDSTLIVFTADHGESLGAHKERTHGIFAYNTTLHVPMIFAGPGVPRGKHMSSLARTIDITPTIMDIMKFPPNPSLDGNSLIKFWNSNPEPPNRITYFEALSVSINRNWAPIRGFFSGNYKYIYLPVPELYDLSKDPTEQNNLCSTDKQLCAKYQEDYTQFARMVGVKDVIAQDVDPEVAEKLRALGYITATRKSASRKTNFTVADDPKNLVELDWMLDDALSAHNKGNNQKAAELLEQVLAKRSDFTMAYLHLAYFYDELGQPQKSIITLKKAIANKIEDAEVFARLGLYQQEIGQFQEAVASIRKGIELDPREVEAMNFLGMAYTNSEQYEQAEKVFHDALQIDPSVAITYNNLGVLYLRQKQYQAAMKNYQTAIKYDPQLGSAYNGLGVIYASTGEPQKAIEEWQKAAMVDPAQIDALLNIGYTYLKLNQGPRAADAFQKFLDKAPPVAYREEIEKVQQIMQSLAKS
jgi:arylsulfatase A-like enzyme/Tfp pilus assembly protein PilF